MKRKVVSLLVAIVLLLAIAPMVSVGAYEADYDPLAPAATVTPKVATTRYGAAATVYTVRAISPNAGTLTYQWQYNDSGAGGNFYNITGETRNTISIGTNKSERMWIYRCAVTNTRDRVSTTTYVYCAQIINDYYEFNFPFVDVAPTAWYRPDIETIYRYGLLNGRSATTFAPNEEVTVAEAVKLAVMVHQFQNQGYATVENGSPIWYSTYMSYALANGILEFDLTADANRRITRQEFVYVLFNSMPRSQYAEINYIGGTIPDIERMSQFADSIYTFYRAGIVTGATAAGHFNPTANILRSEVATIINRMLDITQRREFNLY